MRSINAKTFFVRLAATCWFTVLIAGGWCVARYSTIPGPVVHPQADWPVADQLPRAAGIDTLVMTLHPDCPCSGASVSELEVLMARCSNRLSAIVLFVQPTDLVQDLSATGLWKSVNQIAGVRSVKDTDGQLAIRFGAKTSGQVFLYDQAGRLRFNGGITNARGHAGDSDGMDAIFAIETGRVPTTTQCPVFGCSLR